MGSKVHPYGFRVGVSKPWKSVWFNEKNYEEYLHEDKLIRDHIAKVYERAGVADVIIERPSDSLVKVDIHASRVGMIIGKKGSEIKALRDILKNMINNRAVKVYVHEVKSPYTNAQLVGEDISGQLQRRVSHKVALKRTIGNAMRRGAKGIKVMVSGRLGGADIARTEWYMEGRLPLQTLRSDIDYASVKSETKYGTIGIKVWIYKGDVQL
ncbi:30S ribosomal protein S3 [Oceanotoga sp. DSM 15011]|uniref:Small ribosomal subunit protein uS3 n=1 Tax=Oceanotoga teriensis TaxID=515440 RepID=A0AA45C659_9BACT|nr:MULTISPECIES: 30S ribosomal protein S3 [Oceanotoga]MDO7975642.1 30S ribosomal protein S3 [Oceanotoga teriensis]PWJ90609.1 small subunit ribosomal protein S3 [Oceanotoga teriensis]UYO99852.1 30S ribosomal protein S3 [Oceanotoga sp. DSM 15011]